MVIVNSYLAWRWDLWIIWGIEPSLANKRYVERFGLSSKKEHMGETSRSLYLDSSKDFFIRLD